MRLLRKMTHSHTASRFLLKLLLKIEIITNITLLVRREDVMAAWSGLRPLVTDPNSKDTQSISRNHVIEVCQNKLITIAGGKWTTYRSMAKDVVDAAVKECDLQPSNGCVTDQLLLEGGEGWTDTHYIKLAQEHGIETSVSFLFGTYAFKVRKIALKNFI